ncbi:hypothetical protein ABT173_27700 [Streptomyces sp. NPDC001795]|uniref:hypothetical protein n=1 Tax=unclassified Streptomyces TaxID=2593676 RepID=UPI003324626D
MTIRKRISLYAGTLALVAGTGIAGLTGSAQAAQNTPHISTICKAHYVGSNGAYSQCSPPRAMWTHRIVLVCLTPANVQYKKHGPWVGGYSTSKKYCDHSWDDLDRAYVQEYSEPPA